MSTPSMTAATLPAHGPNAGHGFAKYVYISADGRATATLFPSMIARAQEGIVGNVATVPAVAVDGRDWWVGEDALYANAQTTILAQDRLRDPVFIPALVASAIKRLQLSERDAGYCVSGLPASWASIPEHRTMLGARLREGAPEGLYRSVRIVPEPVAIAYGAAMDNFGRFVGDDTIRNGNIAVVDLGHHTVDIAVVRKLSANVDSTDTWSLGTAHPLQRICSMLNARYELRLDLFETDQAVRRGYVVSGGEHYALPQHWDQPLIAVGESIVTHLVQAWTNGRQFDRILVGGGGAELEPLLAAIRQRFKNAVAVAEPQMAVALGYARLARFYGSRAA